MNTPNEIQEYISLLLSEGKHEQAAGLAIIEFEIEPDFETYMMALACSIEGVWTAVLETLVPVVQKAVEEMTSFSESYLEIRADE